MPVFLIKRFAAHSPRRADDGKRSRMRMVEHHRRDLRQVDEIISLGKAGTFVRFRPEYLVEAGDLEFVLSHMKHEILGVTAKLRYDALHQLFGDTTGNTVLFRTATS